MNKGNASITFRERVSITIPQVINQLCTLWMVVPEENVGLYSEVLGEHERASSRLMKGNRKVVHEAGTRDRCSE